MEHRKYLREEKARALKQQLMFTLDGALKHNEAKHAVIEGPKIDFTRKVTCPLCLAWQPLSSFLISTKKGYHKGLGNCKSCGHKVKLQSLFGLSKWTPEQYAKFIVDYPAAEFWKRCSFEQWKKNLALMKWTQPFWNEYKRLLPKLDEVTEADNEMWASYDSNTKGADEP